MAEETNEIALHHPTKKTNSGLIFYRSCVVNTQTFSVGHNILLRDENRNKLGYLLKIYCRTKGNERALVRWYFTDADLDGEKQVCGHEVFATSYTGKVAISSIRKLVHIRFEKNQHAIPTSVPKDIYYVFRYYDHEKQCLVPHDEQLIKVRYMPKPEPDSAGSALSGANILEEMKVETKLYSPYLEGGFKYYKVCMVGKQRYNVGDCVLLTERDGSSMRRITRFSYSQHKAITAMGQFIYFQNELSLSEEQRNDLHPQEVVASNWQSELLMNNVKRRIHLQHLNIFQPVPQSCPKNIYYLKRFYEPFKKKLFPLLQPLNKSDISIIPEPAEDPDEEAVLCEDDGGVVYRCTIGEDKFDVGDFISLQSGSAIGRVLKLWKEGQECKMSVLRLYLQKELPSVIRDLVSYTSQLITSDEIYTMSCHLYFDTVSVDLGSSSPVDGSYSLDNFFDVEKNELYSLKSPLNTEDIQKIPERGDLVTDSSSSSSSSSYSEDDTRVEEKRKRRDRRTNEPRKRAKQHQEKKDEIKEEKISKSPEETIEKKESKEAKEKEKHEIRVQKEEQKEEKLVQFQKHQKEQNRLISDLQEKQVKLSEVHDHNQYSWAVVGNVKARVGDCVFVKLVEGIQMGRIISIYKDKEEVMRLKMFRYYLEEEMFVTPKESRAIHINEAFACDFVIYALLCQLDELVDVIYLKKKERIPPQKEIPKGRLYVRRYYHPIKHIMRMLKTPLDADDLTIVPLPNPPIHGTFNKSLNLEVTKSLNTSVMLEDSVEQMSTPVQAKEKKRPKPAVKTTLFQAITKSLSDAKKTVQSKDVETPSTPKLTVSENLEGAKAVEEVAKVVEKGAKAVEKVAKAVGEGAKAVGEGAKAVGEGAKAVGEGAKAVGEGAKAVGECAKVVGEGAKAVGEGAKAIEEKPIVDPPDVELLHCSAPPVVPQTVQIIESVTTADTSASSTASIQIVTTVVPHAIQIISSTASSPHVGDIMIVENSELEQSTQNDQQQIHIIPTSDNNQIQIIPSGVEDSQIQISENQIQISENQIQISENQIQIPMNQVEISTNQIEISTNQIEISTNQIEIPINQIEISTNQIQIPMNQVEISTNQIQISTNQIEISTKQIEISKSQIQIVPSGIDIGEEGETTQIQIIPSDTSSDDKDAVEQKVPLVPSIISSEQSLDSSLSVDISHTSDGSITIAPIQSILTTAKFEDSYTEDGRTLYRKCHFKEETISQGDTVYIRCGDTDTESWKIGRVMEFYHKDHPCVRVMWFYGEEEMVVSKNELASIHEKEIFASTCFDEVELSSIESQVTVVYLQKGESIPRDVPTNTLYCKRFYDPYRHMIRQLKTRLQSADVSILPEPAKRPRTERILPTLPKNTENYEQIPQVKKAKTDLEESALVADPLDDTKAPLDVTKTTLDVTKAPLDDSKAPLDVTKAPLDDTKAPLDVTKAPLDDTKAPLDDSKAPLDVTKAPLDVTKATLDVTKAPLDVTKTTLDVTKAPLDVTKAPLDISQHTEETLTEKENTTKRTPEGISHFLQ